MSKDPSLPSTEVPTSAISHSEKGSEERDEDTRVGVVGESQIMDWDSPEDSENPQNVCSTLKITKLNNMVDQIF
jgi:hypothetical protein